MASVEFVADKPPLISFISCYRQLVCWETGFRL